MLGLVNWKDEVLAREEVLINDLKQLVSIPSVLDESSATEDAPFGPEPKRALEWLLEEGQESGLHCEKY